MKQGSTLFLKLAVFVIGIPVLALCIFMVSMIAKYIAEGISGCDYVISWHFNNYVCIGDTILRCVVSGI